MPPSGDDEALREALAASQRLGLLGNAPVSEVIDHATAYVTALAETSGTVIDLGTGGGVPGLVVAAARPDLRLILVDRSTTRTDHLDRQVRRLHWDERVKVVCADAKTLDGPPADAVVARSFGPPVSTLTVATAMVREGGLIVISEPPTKGAGRWPAGELARAGVAVIRSPDPRVATFRRARST